MRYKEEIVATLTSTQNELQETRRAFVEANDEKTIEMQKRIESDKKLVATVAKHEEEIRLRLDFEIKINKLHNLTMALKNHEVVLNRKIEALEHDLGEYRARCQTQQEEIVTLRSWKLQQQMIKNLDDVKIESVQKTGNETKQQLISVTQNI